MVEVRFNECVAEGACSRRRQGLVIAPTFLQTLNCPQTGQIFLLYMVPNGVRGAHRHQGDYIFLVRDRPVLSLLLNVTPFYRAIVIQLCLSESIGAPSLEMVRSPDIP